MSSVDLTAVTFLQLAVILAVVRLVGTVARRVGQPQVVGEMIAGVMLGPSLFGWLLPELHSTVFPEASLSVLRTFSQLGLVLYMFLVGTEFSIDMIRVRVRSAAGVSFAGIAGPFLLSSLLTLYIYTDPAFFAPGVSKWGAILFMGAAMSITAFPVMARIIQERGLTGTSLGSLALASGAIDDAAAWCSFAVVLAIFNGDPRIALLAFGGTLAYAGVVALVRRYVLCQLRARARRNQGLSGPMMSFVLMLVMLAAWFTEYVGIHAVFGAFILGVAMPRGVVTRDLHRRLEPVATSFLVPLFFVSSGMNTQLGLVVTPELWILTAIVLGVACVGKGGACWLAGRFNGETNRDALALGTLMNARGLMELILLNIALERGIITPGLFTIMVIMAVGTTLMASPVFELIYWRQRLPVSEMAEVADASMVVKV